MVYEARIVDDVAEGFLADFALADARVTIYARAQIGLGIVQMKREDLFHANQLVQFPDRLGPAVGRAEVMAGGEEVGGIQAEPEPLGVVHAIENSRQVSRGVAQAGPLARRVFQRDAHRGFGCQADDFVQSRDDLF